MCIRDSWDPSEPQATRVLAMTRWEANGTQVKEHLYCMHDAMKNVTSLFGEARGRRALYEYLSLIHIFQERERYLYAIGGD